MKPIIKKKVLFYDSSHADYKRLFEESPIPMWIYDNVTLRFIAVNAAAIGYYGYTNEEFLRMSIQDIRPNEDISTSVEIIKAPMLNNFYDSSKRRHLKKNGDVFYAQVYSHPVQFTGKVARVMLAMDINNKVLMEHKNTELNILVREQKSRLDEILSSVTEIIWSCKADDMQVLYINDSCLDVYGYTPEELMKDSKLLSAAIHNDDKNLVKKETSKVLLNGSAEYNFRIYHKDGSLKYLHTHAILKEHKGDAVINGITTDITQMFLAEEAMKEYSKKIEKIMESITDGFFAVNAKWEFTYINKASEILLNNKKEELIGKNIWENFPNAIGLKFHSELHAAFDSRTSVHFEDFIPELNRWIAVNAYPSKDGLSVYFRDINEDKEQRMKIEEQNKTLKEIAWIQSHKVRGPVANIIGLAQLFNYENPADPINKEIMDGIKVMTSNLDELIQEVVEITNISILPDKPNEA